MDKEINKIIDNLENCFGIFDYVITPIESNLLVSYIKKLQQESKKQKELIDRAIKQINDYKIYCENNKGFTEYTDIEIEAIEPVISKLEDILKEVSE